MAIVTSSNKTKTVNQINSNNLKQLDSVFTENVASSENTETTAETKTKKTTAKKDNSDTLLLNLPKGERNRFKAFCALNNITMTDFIYFSMDFVKDMVEQGKFTVGRSGIKVLSQD